MRLLTKTFLTLAGGLLLITVPARADDFIFNDLTETLTVTHVGNSDTIFFSNCTAESCAIAVKSNDPNEVTLFEAGIGPPPVAIAEPGGVDISDEIGISIAEGIPGYVVDFFSDPDPHVVGTCATFTGGCSIIEDGSVQSAMTLTWKNSITGATRTDTIKFASDVDVPEPATLLLLGTGLLGVVGAVRRKWLG